MVFLWFFLLTNYVERYNNNDQCCQISAMAVDCSSEYFYYRHGVLRGIWQHKMINFRVSAVVLHPPSM